MIDIRNVTKRFGEKAAVDNLSLMIDKGIYGLVGRNGAGKSTLFRCICGVYDLDEGEVLVDTYLANTKQAKELIFFLPDDPYSGKHDNIMNILDLYENFYDIDRDNFLRLVNLFELPTKKMIMKFSKGMKRLAYISLALSVKTKYLILDEAFDGLDPIVIETVKEELLKAKEKGQVIIASSHNVVTLERLVDNFILVTDGKLSTNESNEKFGQNFIKFQGFFKIDVTEEMFTNAGIRVVSFKKFGSIYNIVVMDDENIDEKMNNVAPANLLERVQIDADEIVKLSMLCAGKESRK